MSKKIKCHACGEMNYSSDIYCRKCNGTLYERHHLNEKKFEDNTVSFK